MRPRQLITTLWRRLSRRRRARLEELNRELDAHFAFRAESLMNEGMEAEAARREARRRIGGEAGLRKLQRAMAARDRGETRQRLRIRALDLIRHGLRTARREAGMTVVVALTIGLGIGLNTGIVAVAEHVLNWQPEGVRSPEQLSRLYFTQTFRGVGRVTQAVTSNPVRVAIASNAATVEGSAAYATTTATFGRGADALRVDVTLVSGSYFEVLGATVVKGRGIVAGDDRADADPVVVLGHGFWRRTFGSRDDILGRGIEIAGVRYTVIGVAGAEFTGVEAAPVDVFLPLSAAAPELQSDQWERATWMYWLRVIARTNADVSADVANAELSSIHQRVMAETEAGVEDASVRLGPLSEMRGLERGPAATTGRITLWLTALSYLMLGLICLNVGNLLAARGLRRRPQQAVRNALGGSRSALLAESVAEVLPMFAAGGVLAGAIAVPTARFMTRTLETGDAAAIEVGIRGPAHVLVVMAAAGAIALLPALWQIARDRPSGFLRSGAREVSVRGSGERILVGLQCAVALILFVGSGLFVASLRNATAIDLGFDAERVLVASWDHVALAHDAAEKDALYNAAAKRLRTLPNVESVAIAVTVPFHSTLGAPFALPGRAALPSMTDGGPYVNPVSPEYLATLGTRVLRGRDFDAGDHAGSMRVAIVNETMASLLWPNQEALGKCILVGRQPSACTTIVGIAESSRRMKVDRAPVHQYYVPMAQAQVFVPEAMSHRLFVRLRRPNPGAIAEVRSVLQGNSPELPYLDAHLLSDNVAPGLRPWRLGATLFSLFALVVAVLVVLGVYGTTSYAVRQRRREIGVRRALGAPVGTVLGTAIGRAIADAATGLIAGMTIAWIAAPQAAPLLHEVSPRNALVMIGAAAGALVCVFLAAARPALEAARTSPTEVLRSG